MSFVAPENGEDEDIEVYRKDGLSKTEGAPLMDFRQI